MLKFPPVRFPNVEGILRYQRFPEHSNNILIILKLERSTTLGDLFTMRRFSFDLAIQVLVLVNDSQLCGIMQTLVIYQLS